MPVVKQSGFNRYNPPSPSIAGDEDMEEFFLKDVDKMHDILPQPFRRIDKLLDELYEIAWEEIEKRQREKQHEESAKVNIDKVVYDEELVIKDKVQCIVVSNNLLFIGSSEKISVFNIPTLRLITMYEWISMDDRSSEKANAVRSLHVIANNDDSVLLMGLDDKGELRLLAFSNDTFYLIDTLNTLDANGSSSVAEKVLLSEDGMFLAVSWEDTVRNWLEVYKLPKESWFSQLSSIEGIKDEDVADIGEEKETQLVPGDFQKLSSVLKLEPPILKANTGSLSMSMKNIDPESPVIGSGVHHCLTSTFFKNLHLEFREKCKIPDNIDLFSRRKSKATVHFLKGQTTSSMFPSRCPADAFNAIAVWWENSNQLSFYVLSKSKDPREPYSVIPHLGSIKLSCVNSLTNLVATYTANRCISVWNRYLGQSVKVLTGLDNDEITVLHFNTVYLSSAENRLMYCTRSGKLCQFTCERSDISPTICLDDRSSPMFTGDSLISVIDGPTNLLTTIWNSGYIVVYNQISSTALCQLEIFNDDCAQCPKGDQLYAVYAKEYIIVVRDESKVDENRSVLFIFTLETSPLLYPFIGTSPPKCNDEENVDSLEKYFLKFVRKCKLEETVLFEQVHKQYQEQHVN